MPASDDHRPWLVILFCAVFGARKARGKTGRGLFHGELLRLIEEKKFAQARERLNECNEVDIAEWLDDFEKDSRALVIFRLLPKEMAADVFSYLSPESQQHIVEGLTDRELAGVIEDLFLDDTVDFLEEMPASIVKRVIATADTQTRAQLNQLLMYPPDSAGSLMTPELMELDGDWTVARALAAVRRQCEDKASISWLYVTDGRRHLVGVVDLRSVLAAPDAQRVDALMEPDVKAVRTHDDQADVAAMFRKYDLLAMPVVDNERRLVGVITIDDVVDVLEEETTEDIYKMAAMTPAERGYMETDVLTLAKNRVLWLVLLMISATFTGFIIARFDAALAANVLLASFIPMLMDTSGNAGSQASVSVIRGITLGEIRFSDLPRVMWKELRVSLLAGMGVAAVNFLRVWLMYGDPVMALVVSLTLVFAIMAAKLFGCALPLLAARVGLDPALMAGPLITTVADPMALLLFFNIAMLLMPGLSG